MAKPYRLLRDKMTPESRARAETRAQEILREMPLDELREARDLEIIRHRNHSVVPPGVPGSPKSIWQRSSTSSKRRSLRWSAAPTCTSARSTTSSGLWAAS
jgi:hypothetical protein